MPMFKITTDKLKAGMKFTKNVFDSDFNLIFSANVELTEEKINEIRAKGIKIVETAGDLLLPDGSKYQEEEKPQETIKPININKGPTIQENKTEPQSSQVKQDNKDVKPLTDNKSKNTISVDKNTAKYVQFYKDNFGVLSNLYRTYKLTRAIDLEALKKTSSKIADVIYKEPQNEVFINLVNIFSKEEYFASHVLNVTILSLVLGKILGQSYITLNNLSMSCLLYDIAMLTIPSEILEKTSELTKEEYGKIKTHPILGYQIIRKDLKLSVDIARVALEHHERIDGSGYPRGVKGDEISDFSKLIGIIDTYEAMTRAKVYRQKKEAYEAMKIMLGENSPKFDTKFLKTFLSMMSIYPVGSYVKLNTKEIAVVVSSESLYPFRPNIKIIADANGNLVQSSKIINLSKEPNLYITHALSSDTFETKI